jgi:excisionase family DNA binding protein
MSVVKEQANPPSLLGQAILDAIRQAVREEIQEAFAARDNGQGLAKKDWLKADEAAQLYGLPKTWFEERGRAGDIARTKPGRYTLFHRRDIEAYLERNKGTDWPKRKEKNRDGALTSSENGTT